MLPSTRESVGEVSAILRWPAEQVTYYLEIRNMV
jgi:hypothetical protein